MEVVDVGMSLRDNSRAPQFDADLTAAAERDA